jgi:hypothetical protein
MHFEINRTMDFYVEIHIRTSLHDVIRVPLYYHVHSDVVKMSPTVIDFGVSPLNFDLLKIPLYAKSKISDIMTIQEILLPLNDARLDFQFVDFFKQGANNVLRKSKELFLGFAILNPTKSGMVENKIILTLVAQRTNKTYT